MLEIYSERLKTIEQEIDERGDTRGYKTHIGMKTLDGLSKIHLRSESWYDNSDPLRVAYRDYDVLYVGCRSNGFLCVLKNPINADRASSPDSTFTQYIVKYGIDHLIQTNFALNE